MTVGWRESLSVTEHAETDVVAVICAKDFPEPQTISDVIAAAPLGTVFLIRDRDTTARAAFDSLGCDYVSVPLNPYYKGEWGDRRADVRDEEILRLSRRVLVFTTPATKTLGNYIKVANPDHWTGKVRVVTAGKTETKKHRKGRKVE